MTTNDFVKQLLASLTKCVYDNSLLIQLDYFMLKDYVSIEFKYLLKMFFLMLLFSFALEIITGPPMQLMFGMPYSEIVFGSLMCLLTIGLLVGQLFNHIRDISSFKDEWQHAEGTPRWGGIIFQLVVYHVVCFEITLRLAENFMN